MKKTAVTLILSLLTIFAIAGNDCMLSELSLMHRNQNASAVIEGVVTTQHAFWNNDHSRIYTLNTVEVYTVYKGKSIPQTLEVITEGGEMDGMISVYTSTLVLQNGAKGIFFLAPANGLNWNISQGNTAYRVYASSQGFIVYDKSVTSAADPFKIYSSVKNDLIPVLKKLNPGSQFVTYKKMPKSNAPVNSNKFTSAITSFSPSTVSAGTKTVLSINGAGFGATRGAGFVEFAVANNSTPQQFGKALTKDYISWNDTLIRVFVPSIANVSGSGIPAGTGIVKVTTNGGVFFQSGSALTVSFSHFNVLKFSGDSSLTLVLRGDNGLGGITFSKNNAFLSNTAASSAFDRAFINWRCAVGINWLVSPTGVTANTHSVSDNINVITFDNAQPLDPGVLGRGELAIGKCPTPDSPLVVVDWDIRFSANAANNIWNFTTNPPAGTEADFETVALHELGHLTGLNHTNNNSDVMFPSIALGQSKRILQSNDIAGAANMLVKSVTNINCVSPMTAFNFGTMTVSIGVSPALPVCAGTPLTFSITVTGNGGIANFQWRRNSSLVGTNNDSLVISTLDNGDTISCTVTSCTQSANSNSIFAGINPLPSSPGTVTGTTCVKAGDTLTLVTTGITNAATYNWSLPSGLSVLGINSDDTIKLIIGSGFVSGGVLVNGVNACGSGGQIVVTALNTKPINISSITGTACLLAGDTGAFSVPVISNASSYLWTIPSNTTVVGANNQSMIKLILSAAFTSGSLKVAAVSSCGNSPTDKLITIRRKPATPGAITGTSSGLCGLTKTYSITSVSGASSYGWLLPIGAAGTSTATSIAASFTQSFVPGNISVSAKNTSACVSNASLKSLTGAPATPTTIIGPIIFPVNQQFLCSVSVNTSASSYIWSTSGGGGVIVSGQGNDTAVIKFNTAGSTKKYCARAVNSCGSSSSKCKTINITLFRNAESRLVAVDDNSLFAEISPNPVFDELHLGIYNFSTHGSIMLEIYSVTGQQLYSHQIQSDETVNDYNINVNQLQPGIYFIRLLDHDAIYTTRFIKM